MTAAERGEADVRVATPQRGLRLGDGELVRLRLRPRVLREGADLVQLGRRARA
jgi:hypothetical protein